LAPLIAMAPALVGHFGLALSDNVLEIIFFRTLIGFGYAIATLAFVSPTIQAFFGWQVLAAVLNVAVVRVAAWRAIRPEEGARAPRFRLAVASIDPEIPNWLDTEGRPDGLVSYRYVWSSDAPVPTSRVVKTASLRAHLPAFTPTFAAAARRDQIARRRRAIARRFRR